MSFQRSLTGESSIYANVILNTNICASTVSTINLSATNASFTNITTNTWTTGNVSTPNVIATNGYFSNLNTCNFSLTTVNTSNLYSSNASFTNVSISTKLTVPNISSLRNIFSDQVIGIYSSGGVSIRDNNQSNSGKLALYYASTALVDTYGLVLETNKSGVSGGYSKIVAGQNLSFQIYADTVLQAENTSTSGWTFYSSINGSTGNISTLTSSVINVCTLNAKNFNVSTFSIVNLNCSNISTNYACVSFAYTFATTAEWAFYNLSRDEYNDLYVLSYQYRDMYSSKPAIHIDGLGTSYYFWTLASGASNVSPFLISVSGVSVSNLQSPGNLSSVSMNTCYLTGWRTYASEVSVSGLLSLQGGTLSFRKSASTTVLSGQYVLDENTSNPIMYNDGLGITKYIFNTSGTVPALYFDSSNICALGSNLYVSNISVSRILINNISARQVSSTSMATSWLNSSNISVSNLSTTTITGTTLGYTTANISTLSLSNAVVNMCVSLFYASSLAFTQNGTTSQYGLIQYGTNRCIIQSVGSLAPILALGNSGNTRFEISQNGVSSYVPFYVSTGNFSTLNASVFAPASITTSTINVSTLNSSSITVSQLNTIGNFITPLYNSGTVLRNFSVVQATNFMTDPTSLALNYTYMNLGVSSETAGLTLTANQTQAVIDTNVFLTMNFTHNAVSTLTHIRNSATDRRWVFYSNICNACNTYLSNVSVTNLSATNLTVGAIDSSNLSIGNISIATELTAALGTITRLNSTSIFVSNLSASNASVTGRITVSNISTTSVSATGRINADNIRSANDIVSVGGTVQAPLGSIATFSASSVNVSQGVACSFVSATQVSSTSMATSWLNASNISVANSSLTTLTGTTVGYSTGNFSTIAMSNPVVNMSVSNLYCSSIGFLTNGTVSSYGNIQLASNKLVINSASPAATGVQIANSGNIRFEVSLNGTSSFVPFYASTGNFCNLNVSGTIIGTTINGSVYNFSSGNFSTANGITGNFSTLNVSTTVTATSMVATSGNFSTIYASNIFVNNLSDVNYINSTGSLQLINDSIYITNAYASIGGTVFLQMNYWNPSVSALQQGFNFFSDSVRGSVMDSGNLPLVFQQSNIPQLTNTYTSGWLFKNVINSSYQVNLSKLFVTNLSSTDYTTSTMAVSNITATNMSISNMTVSANLTIPMNISTDNNSGILTIFGNSTNTQTTGIKIPNYIDGIDTTTGLFIGYNHTGGFVNFNRALRSFANINLDGNLNQITTTNNLGVGRNLTTGNLFIGDTAMTGNISINTSGTIQIGNTTTTGNISIDTTGDVIFGCDRRSTWNTSGLIASSTQLGSFYITQSSNSFTKINTGQTFVFNPTNNNVSLTVFPVGLYQVTVGGAIRTQSNVSGNFNGVVSVYNAGICYGTGYNFGSGNTTRSQLMICNTPSYMTNTSGVAVPFSATGLLNMTTTGNYIGVFASATMTTAATAGSLYMEILYTAVVKIA